MRSIKSQLVASHIERIPRAILEDHPAVLREYVKGKRGVYALYKKNRLYYVGLATNLRNRMKAHLRDRHAHAWDLFSLYLTTKDEHLRELEALVMRITMPSGNRSRTKFAKSEDLRRSFKRRIEESQRHEIDLLFGGEKRRKSKLQTKKQAHGSSALSSLVSGRLPIRMTYKGKLYKATVLADGKIRFGGKTFGSPSMAARAVTKRAVNGWWMWKYPSPKGQWARLQGLRKA